jgi:hypothetical protein
VASTEAANASRDDSQAVENVSEPFLSPELEADGPEETPCDYYFVRYGTFMLLARDEVPSVDKLKERLETAIKNESRISGFDPVALRKEWTSSFSVYPRRKDTTDNAMFSGSDRRKALRLSDPISFTVTVPIKNQPEFRGYADIPTDTYYVAWDGITAVVAWDRRADQKKPPRSGGHVVVDILRNLAKSVDLDLYAQACSPGCTNMFAHPIMRLERVEAPKTTRPRIAATAFPCINVHFHCSGEARDVAVAIDRAVANQGYTFALFKNYARRIMDLEALARTKVSTLLKIDYDRIKRLQLSPLDRVKEAWRHRSDKRQARLLVSSLWLVFSSIELLRSDWLKHRTRLSEDSASREMNGLFQEDLGDDDNAVMSQDLSFIRSAVEQTASHQDARALAWTTALVAVAGLLGAVIGGLLTVWLTAKH